MPAGGRIRAAQLKHAGACQDRESGAASVHRRSLTIASPNGPLLWPTTRNPLRLGSAMHLSEADREGSIVDAYARLLEDPDPHVSDKAARDWCDSEESHINPGPTPRSVERYAGPRYRMCFTRLVSHYWRHGAWRADGELLSRVARIDNNPAVLIHGRLDLNLPPDVAWKLGPAWPAAELHVVPSAGHTAGAGISERVVAALDNFASRAAVSDLTDRAFRFPCEPPMGRALTSPSIARLGSRPGARADLPAMSSS
jgi:hypothetical protein